MSENVYIETLKDEWRKCLSEREKLNKRIAHLELEIDLERKRTESPKEDDEE